MAAVSLGPETCPETEQGRKPLPRTRGLKRPLPDARPARDAGPVSAPGAPSPPRLQPQPRRASGAPGPQMWRKRKERVCAPWARVCSTDSIPFRQSSGPPRPPLHFTARVLAGSRASAQAPRPRRAKRRARKTGGGAGPASYLRPRVPPWRRGPGYQVGLPQPEEAPLGRAAAAGGGGAP